EVRFPIHPDKNKELLEGAFLQKLFNLIKVLPQVQNDAVKRVEKAQESTKRKHDLQLPYLEKLRRGDQ
ncbi:31259_t:CDS:1, partial [Gigaspora margarita]